LAVTIRDGMACRLCLESAAVIVFALVNVVLVAWFEMVTLGMAGLGLGLLIEFWRWRRASLQRRQELHLLSALGEQHTDALPLRVCTYNIRYVNAG
jgi:hypothetical protein